MLSRSFSGRSESVLLLDDVLFGERSPAPGADSRAGRTASPDSGLLNWFEKTVRIEFVYITY